LSRDLDSILGSYASDDYSVRLCRGVFKVVPFSPNLPHWTSVEACVRSLKPDARPEVVAHAKELARCEAAQRVLWLFDALDTADTGLTVYSGVSSAIKLARSEKGERLNALETDPQQAADAALKGLAIAYAAWRLNSGGPIDRVQAFRKLDAAQAVLFYYATMDVGVPFADNAVSGGAELVSELFERFGPDQTKKLAAIAGDADAEGAASTLGSMLAPVGELVKSTAGFLTPIAQSAATFAPTVMTVTDKVAGLAATAADALPVYRYLGARLVAEHCARLAIAEVGDKMEQAERENPALMQIKVTRHGDAPVQKKGCFLWPFLFLLSVAGASAGGLWWMA
jgi:hypothetical protein